MIYYYPTNPATWFRSRWRIRCGVLYAVRDLLLFVVIFGSLPLIFYRPHFGIIVWTWLSLMNPHRFTWGLAYDFPFAKVVGAVTLVAMLLSPQRKRLPLTRETILLLIFIAWMLLTTILALEQSEAWAQWDKVSKIQLIVLLTMMALTDRRKLELFIWMIVLSVGFYGVKGGLFTVVNGGVSHVLGPPSSFIEDNNHLGMALVMVIPLMRYLQLTQKRRWVRTCLTAAIILTCIATLGTQSRGAFVGIAVTLGFLALKSRRRLMLLTASVIVAPIALALMPASWHERMSSIRDYRNDSSAMGRINAWGFAVNLATDRPLVGGGFETFSPRWFAVYAPDPTDVHDAHSIYFEVLGEHGFVGLMLFLSIWLLVWQGCSQLIRLARGYEDLTWAADLGRMCQVCLTAYASTGAFVGLAYFDLYYNIIALYVIAKLIVMERITLANEERIMEASPPRRRLSVATH